ncbi:hypothetical protein ABZ897_01115 [Nonomuraea sp. NPDC046802]|uniref:hypothetical protein n=1 Tax=Nonomuraea sp. NPDC046802 TaxID=3154919 RepID=UPI0033FE749C
METVQSVQTTATPASIGAAATGMSVAEAACLISRSREYLYSGLRKGQFPGTQFGRGWTMPREFVESFVRDVLQRGLSISFENYAADWRARNDAEASA